MKDSDWLILSELYKNPNMTKVADLLYTTQPSMTKRLQHMEEEFGVEIPSEDLEKIATVGDVIDYLKAKGVEE